MIDHEDYQAIFPTVLFYARRAILREAIFVSDRLDTLGVGLKLRNSLRACSEGYPVTSDSRLHRELKPADDHFLFLYLALPIKLNLQGLSGVPKLHRFQCILTPTMRHSKQRNSFTKRNHEKQVVLRRESSKIVKIIHKNREGIAGTLKESRNYAIEESRFDMKKSRYRRKGVGVSP